MRLCVSTVRRPSCKRRSRELSEDELAAMDLMQLNRRTAAHLSPALKARKVAKILKQLKAEIVPADLHWLLRRLLKNPDTIAWKQANAQVLEALLKGNLEELDAFWNQAATQDRSWLSSWAMVLNKDDLLVWMLNQPDFPKKAVVPLFGPYTAWDVHFFELLLAQTHQENWPNKNLLWAALESRFPVAHEYEEMLTKRICAAGGQEFARDLTGSLGSPPWEKPPLVTKVEGRSFITCLADPGVCTGDVLLSHAVYSKDAALLKHSIEVEREKRKEQKNASVQPKGHDEVQDTESDDADITTEALFTALLLAVRDGWVVGAELICEFRFGSQVPPNMDLLAAAAVKDPKLACVNMLRSRGLGGALCVEAFWEGRFDLLEQIFREGCPGPAGTSASGMRSENHASLNWWMLGTDADGGGGGGGGEEDYSLDKITEDIEDRVFVDTCSWPETPSARRTAYLASLIHGGVAEKLGPQIQQWKATASAGALAIRKWLEKQSKAYADRHGCAAPSCHMPHVVENILEKAGLITPSVESRAEAIAVKMRTWLGLHSQAFLDSP
eukprot:jgi/Botrbrau1/23643/Bobra.55_2s0029.2